MEHPICIWKMDCPLELPEFSISSRVTVFMPHSEQQGCSMGTRVPITGGERVDPHQLANARCIRAVQDARGESESFTGASFRDFLLAAGDLRFRPAAPAGAVGKSRL